MDTNSLWTNSGRKLKTNSFSIIFGVGQFWNGESGIPIISISTQEFLTLTTELSGGIACDGSGLGNVCFRLFPYSFTQIRYFNSHHPAPPYSLEMTELMARKKSPHFFHAVLLPACHMQPLHIWYHFWSRFPVTSSTKRKLRHDCCWFV